MAYLDPRRPRSLNDSKRESFKMKEISKTLDDFEPDDMDIAIQESLCESYNFSLNPLEAAIEASKREAEMAEKIRQEISDPILLHTILMKLPGVDPYDEMFLEFCSSK
ncbi:hypothetical protein TRFO_31457 [Tritrichomonas foetus]|uniref:Uncharacterized protein n=1 Tax=Tritrichomonas foetus TaxID=1144522 RepID=A0A1J4JVW3_9EUKA|nr:hypothetical protein TRFO_31457 [Tritrichomonas foetus]|eukprot:OHT01670.1 hypothetical protein TRFO_31457 [Tritrichomonas foetus]